MIISLYFFLGFLVLKFLDTDREPRLPLSQKLA